MSSWIHDWMSGGWDGAPPPPLTLDPSRYVVLDAQRDRLEMGAPVDYVDLNAAADRVEITE